VSQRLGVTFVERLSGPFRIYVRRCRMRHRYLGTVVTAIGCFALVTGWVTGHQEKKLPDEVLVQTVILKPGESQELLLSAPPKTQLFGRTQYYVDNLPKGVKWAKDDSKMQELQSKRKLNVVCLKILVAADAKEAEREVKVRIEPFAGPPNYVATIKVLVVK